MTPRLSPSLTLNQIQLLQFLAIGVVIRGIAKPYAARVKDGSNTITTAAYSNVNAPIHIDKLLLQKNFSNLIF